MEQGQTVTYYTHTGSDGNNDTQDEVAIVLRAGEKCSDLVVFPVGGPVKFVQACEFDPDDPYLVDGGSYIRDGGSDAPDFSERFKYSGTPEYAAAINRIRAERDAAPGNRREEVKERHKKEMAEVVKGLEEKNRPEGEPLPAGEPLPGVPRTPRNPPGGPPNPSPAPARRDV